MKKTIVMSVWVGLCLAVGATATWFQSPAIDEWYPMLIKPSITPANAVFPVAWGIVYVCMGLSAGIMWQRPYFVRLPAIALFLWQLLLNFMWSILFFAMQSTVLGFVDIVLLDVAVVLYMLNVYRVSRGAAWLMAPCVAWLVLATYLNAYIVVMN